MGLGWRGKWVKKIRRKCKINKAFGGRRRREVRMGKTGVEMGRESSRRK